VRTSCWFGFTAGEWVGGAVEAGNSFTREFVNAKTKESLGDLEQAERVARDGVNPRVLIGGKPAEGLTLLYRIAS
jgi:hypothetical protein